MLTLWQNWVFKPGISNFKAHVVNYETTLSASLFVPKSADYSGF